MRKLQNILMILSVLILSACNKSAVDSEPEDYKKIFGIKEIPEPNFDYSLAPTLPCNPLLEASDYEYSGRDMKEKKKYTVTVKFWFLEKELLKDEKPNKANTDIYLKFVNENKQLEVLNTKTDFQNEVEFEKNFEVESGFPLFLGIVGSGYNDFQMRASVEAVSKDGLIKSPKLEYEIKIRTDGFSDELASCETIILP